jgi:hypothetical protein
LVSVRAHRRLQLTRHQRRPDQRLADRGFPLGLFGGNRLFIFGQRAAAFSWSAAAATQRVGAELDFLFGRLAAEEPQEDLLDQLRIVGLLAATSLFSSLAGSARASATVGR